MRGMGGGGAWSWAVSRPPHGNPATPPAGAPQARACTWRGALSLRARLTRNRVRADATRLPPSSAQKAEGASHGNLAPPSRLGPRGGWGSAWAPRLLTLRLSPRPRPGLAAPGHRWLRPGVETAAGRASGESSVTSVSHAPGPATYPPLRGGGRARTRSLAATATQGRAAPEPPRLRLGPGRL